MRTRTTLSLMIAALTLIAAPAFAEEGPAGKPEGGPGKDGMRKMMMEKLWQDSDTNKDGQISKDEFLAQHTKRFTEMDANGDGQLAKDELRAFHQKKMEERKARREGGPDGAPEGAPVEKPAE